MLSKRTDGYISRMVNRRISSRITNFIINHNINITPNEVSFISFLIGIIAGLLIFYEKFILGATLVQLSSIIDGVDGELARARGISSSKGAFIDSMLDRLADTFILITLILTLFKSSTINLVTLNIGLLAITGSILVSYLHSAGERSLKKHPLLITRLPPIASRDIRLFIIFILTLLGTIELELIILAILTYTYIICQIILISIKYNEKTI